MTVVGIADEWTLVFDIIVLLSSALVLGLLFTRLRQGALVGYLLAGTLVGPSALGLVRGGPTIVHLAELGVAMLLFTIGLEFSWRRLVSMGRLAAGAVAQVTLTLGVGAGIAVGMGIPAAGAFAMGAVLALSSTAVVLRLLKDRAEVDSLHGRTTSAVLLTQDVLVIPLVLAVTFLGGDRASLAEAALHAVGGTLLFVLSAGLVAGLLIPRLLSRREVAQNREFPILLAIATVVSAAYTAHAVGMSPALGAFIAGMLLAETRFADQIRADVTPLRTIFVTLFFASIGLLLNLPWVMQHWGLVLGVTAVVMVLKAGLAALALRPFQPSSVACLSAGLCLAQVGEFSFILAGIAHANGLLSEDQLQLIIACSLLSLLMTPFMVAKAYPWGRWLAIRVVKSRTLVLGERRARPTVPKRVGHAVLVGYGDAGEAAAGELVEHAVDVVVMEVNPQRAAVATEQGRETLIADATQAGNLVRADLASASVAIVALPDATTARMVVSQCKLLAPHVPVVARARYHAEAAEIDVSGADIVVDEEQLIGRRLGKRAGDLLGRTAPPRPDAEQAIPPVWR